MTRQQLQTPVLIAVIVLVTFAATAEAQDSPVRLTEPSAFLDLPSQGSPGLLQLSDGRTFHIVDESDFPYAIGRDIAGPQPATPTPTDAGAGQQQDNGTNPAQNITTCIISNEYYELDGGNQINTTYARLKFPFAESRGSLLVEIPFAFYDFTAQFPTVPEVGGLADVKFQLSYNTFTTYDQKLTMINFMEFYVPSSDNFALGVLSGGNELTAFNLGTGKYVLGPGIGFVYAVQPNFIIAPLYFFEASVAGDDNRQMIRRGKWRIFGMYAWESGLYVMPEFQVLTNYLTGNNDIYVAPEFGLSAKGVTFYCKPGVGLSPDQNDRQWGLDFGVRVQF